MSSASDSAGDERPIAIDDPEEYNQTRRLRQVHNARERFPEVVREEGERATAEDITYERYLEIVSETLAWFLIELEPILTSEQLEEQPDEELVEYWDEKPVGEIGLTLEEIAENFGEDGDGEPITKKDSIAAFRLANRFFNRVGFGLSFDEGLPEDEL